MVLLDHFPNTLTDDQESAVQKIKEFLDSSTNCFLLKGYAGTGKTFLRDLFTFVDFKYRTNTKVIFIGDNAQLPPIDMSFSPLWKKNT